MLPITALEKGRGRSMAIKLYQGRTYMLLYRFMVDHPNLHGRLFNYDIGKDPIPLRIQRTANVRVLSGIILQNHISLKFFYDFQILSGTSPYGISAIDMNISKTFDKFELRPDGKSRLSIRVYVRAWDDKEAS